MRHSPLGVLSMFLAGLALTLSCSMPAYASSSVMPITIDHFVATLFPKANHYYWVVNDSKKETQREMIVDIHTFVTHQQGTAPITNRFLLLILDGEIFAAQNIPLDATVDCGPDKEEV